MKIKIFLVYFILCSGMLTAQKLQLDVAAESAILVNADTGAILYEKNPHAPRYPASITKIATALYTLKKKTGQLNELVVAEQESIASITTELKRKRNYSAPSYLIEQDSTHAGIKKDEAFKLIDLLYMMMIVSANDAANVIAQHVGKNIPDFMDEVNIFLKNIGCQQTHFSNPHGLHHPQHQTTAFDMALMTREAFKDPVFRKMVSTVKFTRPKSNKQAPAPLIQTNMLLRNGKLHYSKAVGVKTGHTSHALNTFVAAAEYEGRTLIAVLLKSKDRSAIFKDAVQLFEAAFNQPKVKKIYLSKGNQKFSKEIVGAKNLLETYSKEDLALEYYPAEEPQFKCLLYWKELALPIQKDDPVAELVLQSSEGHALKKVPLYAFETVESTWLHWFKSFYTSSNVKK